MGLLSFLKRSNRLELKVEFTKHIINNIISVSLPTNWKTLNDNEFRTSTLDGKTRLLIRNYRNKSENNYINEEILRKIILPLYEEFKIEGEYEPYDDLESSDNQISQSFKVDEETQYYLTVTNLINEQLIFTDIIIREIGDYDIKTRITLLNIAKSISAIVK